MVGLSVTVSSHVTSQRCPSAPLCKSGILLSCFLLLLRPLFLLLLFLLLLFLLFLLLLLLLLRPLLLFLLRLVFLTLYYVLSETIDFVVCKLGERHPRIPAIGFKVGHQRRAAVAKPGECRGVRQLHLQDVAKHAPLGLGKRRIARACGRVVIEQPPHLFQSVVCHCIIGVAPLL